MTAMVPGGQGPWFCGLIFNTSDSCKKQTHLTAHTLPHLAVDSLNKKHQKSKDRDHCWVMIMKIGPFERWSCALAFLHLWTDKSRGKFRRIERGLELFSTYQRDYNLKMWTIKETQIHAKQRFFEHSFGNVIYNMYDPAFIVPIKATPIVLEDSEKEDEGGEEEENRRESFMTNLKDLFKEPVIVQRVKEVQILLEKSTAPKKKQKIKK
jgi:hypothetical protein